MRQSIPLAVLLVILVSRINAATAGHDDKMHRALRDGRTDMVSTETEERGFKVPGLNKLSSLFKKNPTISNAVASNPSIANALKDPKVTKTITTLKNKPGLLAKLRRTATYKEIAPKLKTNSLTQRDIEHLGEGTMKASGKKGYMYGMVIAAAATILGLVGIALIGDLTSESD